MGLLTILVKYVGVVCNTHFPGIDKIYSPLPPLSSQEIVKL